MNAPAGVLQAPLPWTREQTRDLLTADPLPRDFTWPHTDGGERPVQPSHSALSGGYGKWLMEGPQFPSLFELINDILVDADTAGEADWLAAGDLRDRAEALDGWSQFLAIELRASRTRHAAELTTLQLPLAQALRRLRRRPGTQDLF